MDDGSIAPPPQISRRKFSADDVQAMLAAGVLRDGEKVELIAGELVEMAPQGPLHWDFTHRLVFHLIRSLPEHLTAASQGPLRLGSYYEPEPEIFVFPGGMNVNAVRGKDVVLAIEIAVTSLAYDLSTKAAVYAGHGVREYWVVDVQNRRTLVHVLTETGYGAPESVPFDASLAAPGGVALTLAAFAPES